MIVFPNLDQIVPDQSIFSRPDCQTELSPISPFFYPIESQPKDHGGGRFSDVPPVICKYRAKVR